MSDKMNEVGQELIDQMIDCNLGNTKPPNGIEKHPLGKKPTRCHTYGAGQLFAIGRYVANKMRDPYAQLEMMPTRLLLIERLRNAGIYRNHLAGLYVNPNCSGSGLSGAPNTMPNGIEPSFRGAYNSSIHRQYHSYEKERQQQQQQQHQQQHQQQQQEQQQQHQQLQQLQIQLQQLQQLQQQQLQQLQQSQHDETQDAGDGDASKFY